jgi:hypothetical protein
MHANNFTPGPWNNTPWNNTPWNNFKATRPQFTNVYGDTMYGNFDTPQFGITGRGQFPVVPFNGSFRPETQFGNSYGVTNPYSTLPVSNYVLVPVTAFGSEPAPISNVAAMPNMLNTFPAGTLPNTNWGAPGSVLHKGKCPKNYRRSDSHIQENICDLLCDDVYLDASDIELTVTNGEVTLTGTVDSRLAKRRAEDLVEYISGVTNVENRLRVVNEWITNRNTKSSDTDTSVTSDTKTKRSTLATAS